MIVKIRVKREETKTQKLRTKSTTKKIYFQRNLSVTRFKSPMSLFYRKETIDC